jgi:membrane-bound lytic murein transglycosylase C
LANKIAQKLKSFEDEEINNFVLVSDSITKFTQKKYVSLLSNQKLERTEYNGKVLFKASIKLPKAFTINQSKHYKTTIIKNAKQSNMPASLIYAVIHSESYFNPMAKSSAPAFGLMQIVPKSEGVDSYYALYGNKKLLSASYLYNSSNNILIGSTYLNILFYKYLKNIKDEQSRLYCTIAAYHTSSGNVASVFIDTPNINQAIQAINSMNSAQVYKELLRKLPYKETKNYLFLVNKRMASYKKILTTVHREY